MALGDPIPDEHTVLRHVKGTLIDQGKVDGSAFVRRRGADGQVEAGLSVEWLETAHGQRVEEKLASIRQTFRRDVTSSHRFVALPVGGTRRAVATGGNVELRFEHEPLDAEGGKPANPHHSEIFGSPEPEHEMALAIGDLIAQQVTELFPAKP